MISVEDGLAVLVRQTLRSKVFLRSNVGGERSLAKGDQEDRLDKRAVLQEMQSSLSPRILGIRFQQSSKLEQILLFRLCSSSDLHPSVFFSPTSRLNLFVQTINAKTKRQMFVFRMEVCTKCKEV